MKDTSGPAFPDGSTNQWGNANDSGLSKREYFAAEAMKPLIQNFLRSEEHTSELQSH